MEEGWVAAAAVVAMVVVLVVVGFNWLGQVERIGRSWDASCLFALHANLPPPSRRSVVAVCRLSG